jgi:hypothetical protein
MPDLIYMKYLIINSLSLSSERHALVLLTP